MVGDLSQYAISFRSLFNLVLLNSELNLNSATWKKERHIFKVYLVTRKLAFEVIEFVF